MSDALNDARQPFKIRRRVARILGAGRSQRAADAVMAALTDLRFEVRYQSAYSLAAIQQRHPSVRIDATRVSEVIRTEVLRGQTAWESRKLMDDGGPDAGERAVLSLQYIFTLLSLVVGDASLQVAFRGLCSEDQRMRATALEYLDA